MRCLWLFKDASGRLPSAQELLRCGFRVSSAALPEQAGSGAALAHAAEAPATYGGTGKESAESPAAAPAAANDALADGGA